MNGNTTKTLLRPNNGRIICDVKGQELLPNRNFQPFHNDEINPKFLTHPEYFKMIAARFSSGGTDESSKALRGIFQQLVMEILAPDPEKLEEYYEIFEHQFYDYSLLAPDLLEPFQGDTGWEEGQRSCWEKEKNGVRARWKRVSPKSIRNGRKSIPAW
ncbi:MAG: hypothetical protein LUD01_00465 [Clostridiales bacterium]|nr:hypothetical protein [Clostridiales bacterium]